jgi:hypothetical protein
VVTWRVSRLSLDRIGAIQRIARSPKAVAELRKVYCATGRLGTTDDDIYRALDDAACWYGDPVELRCDGTWFGRSCARLVTRYSVFPMDFPAVGYEIVVHKGPASSPKARVEPIQRLEHTCRCGRRYVFRADTLALAYLAASARELDSLTTGEVAAVRRAQAPTNGGSL